MKTILALVLTVTIQTSFAQDTTTNEIQKQTIFEITKLTKTAASDKYAFTGEFPVKVGKGANGGPYNQRAYLSLLRDSQGNPVKFRRIGGGCCPYKSENAMFGDYALVDTYEVLYKDKDGKQRKTTIYISFYDYEEPLIPIGFSSSTNE